MNTLKAYLKKLLAGEAIDAFGVIPFSECRVIYPALLDRFCTDWQPQSAIMLAVPYFTGEYPDRTVSLYAVPRDYHRYFRGLYERMEEKLISYAPQYHFKGFADHSPIGETGAAAKAGLGVIGDKFQLIHPVYGSYVFLGEILTDAPFSDYDTVPIRHCSHCGACREACPVSEGCLSYLTQVKGELDPLTKSLIQKTGIAWGCDLCRTSCPMNRHAKETPIPFFREELIMDVTADAVASMPKEKFQMRAYSWRGRNTILRNLRALEEE